MIKQIEQVIREHPEWLHRKESQLSFMKVSTPASGLEKDQGKVLIFVFEKSKKNPSLVVKTARTYRGAGVARISYDNLKLLRETAASPEDREMFPEPLYLYDDGDIIFSIERVCPGTKFSKSSHGIDKVLECYIAWQSRMSKDVQKRQDLPGDIEAPVLMQHGDMTYDNVLVYGKNIYLIDCDYAGEHWLPGFDMYNFLSKLRLSQDELKAYFDKYFPLYFKSIGVEVGSYANLFPHYLEQETLRKEKKL